MKELTVRAVLEELNQVMGFVEETLDECGCSMKAATQINIAVEELFVNIASYAYADIDIDDGEKTAKITIDFDESDRQVSITFEDRGIPYDPLAKPDPDVTLPASERPIGGLGIYMVKKSMDEVTYRYEEGKNILTIRMHCD